jgi:hypothetical protein
MTDQKPKNPTVKGRTLETKAGTFRPVTFLTIPKIRAHDPKVAKREITLPTIRDEPNTFIPRAEVR